MSPSHATHRAVCHQAGQAVRTARNPKVPFLAHRFLSEMSFAPCAGSAAYGSTVVRYSNLPFLTCRITALFLAFPFSSMVMMPVTPS